MLPIIVFVKLTFMIFAVVAIKFVIVPREVKLEDVYVDGRTTPLFCKNFGIDTPMIAPILLFRHC